MLLNKDAVKEQDYVLRVAIDFYLDGKFYQLTRSLEPKLTTQEPRNDTDFEHHLFLSEDGNNLPTQDIQMILNDIMPEEISGFFLFDGEQLNKYEDLLLDYRTQSSEIRQSIEKILGLPAVRNARDDIQSNLDSASKRQMQAAQKDAASSNAANQAMQVSTLKQNTQNEITILGAQRSEINVKRSELEKELEEFKGIEDDIKRKNQLETQVKEQEGIISSSESDLREHLSVAWKDLVYPKVVQVLADKRERKDVLHKRQVLRLDLENQIKQIEQILDKSKCTVCGQTLGSEHITHANQQLADASTAMAKLPFDDTKEQEELEGDIKSLGKLLPGNVKLVIGHVESNHRNAQAKKQTLQSELKDLGNLLANQNEYEIQENRKRYDSLSKNMVLVDESLKKQQEEVEKQTLELGRLSKLIAASGGSGLARLNEEITVYQSMRDIFQGCLDQLRDQLKEVVEKDASEIFLKITTNPGFYGGLNINERYGLRIVDTEGQEIPLRAAGHEQIVALSLISALNKNAVRRAPVVMDTPFGRLDENHRRNVLEHISKMSDQVILLVHGGEIKSETIDSIRPQIDQEYWIQHPSKYRSYITKKSS